MRLSKKTYFTTGTPESSTHASRMPTIFLAKAKDGTDLFSKISSMASPETRLVAIETYRGILEEVGNAPDAEAREHHLSQFFLAAELFWYMIATMDTTACSVAMRKMLARMDEIANTTGGFKKEQERLVSLFASVAAFDHGKKNPICHQIPNRRAMAIVERYYKKQPDRHARLEVIAAVGAYPEIQEHLVKIVPI